MESIGNFFVVTIIDQKGLTVEYKFPPETKGLEDDAILEMVMPQTLKDLAGE